MNDKDHFMNVARKAPIKAHFYIRPRYTSGSPAMVDETTCIAVAIGEQANYEASVSGVYGKERKKMAEKLGLTDICYAKWEKGSKVIRLDFFTGETTLELKAQTL